MRKLLLVIVVMFSFNVEASKPKATKAQTEQWLDRYIQVWDDNKRIYVETEDCKIQIKTKSNSTLLNMKGLLFPVEILSVNRSSSPSVRVRFVNRYSGDYAMDKQCKSDNLYCDNYAGKWNAVSYYDFNITHWVDYVGRDEDLSVKKASKLKAGLEHYAKLCGAKPLEEFKF